MSNNCKRGWQVPSPDWEGGKKEGLAEKEIEIAGLKRRIEAEHRAGQIAFRDAARFAELLSNLRAHADALAGAGDDLISRKNDSEGEDISLFAEWDNLEDTITDYRNREE